MKANPKQICKRDRWLYGHKQAAAPRFRTNDTYIRQQVVQKSATDLCIFICEDINSRIYVTLYVDDMLISAKSSETKHSHIHTVRGS